MQKNNYEKYRPLLTIYFISLFVVLLIIIITAGFMIAKFNIFQSNIKVGIMNINTFIYLLLLIINIVVDIYLLTCILLINSYIYKIEKIIEKTDDKSKWNEKILEYKKLGSVVNGFCMNKNLAYTINKLAKTSPRIKNV